MAPNANEPHSFEELRVEPQYGPSGKALRSYSPDGRFLLAGGVLYDARSLDTIRRDAGAQFTLNGSATLQRTIVRDIETWAVVDDFNDLFEHLYAFKTLMSADGTMFVWAGQWGESTDAVLLVDVATRAFIAEMRVHVQAMEFTQDGKELWIWSYDARSNDKLTIVDTKTGEVVHEQVSAKEDRASLEKWTANTRGWVVQHAHLAKPPGSHYDFHRDFTRIVDRDTQATVAELWLPAPEDPRSQLMGWGERAAQFNGDGSLFAALVGKVGAGAEYEGWESHVVLWDTASWTELRRIALPKYNPREQRVSLSFSSDSRRLQVGEDEYDLVTGRLIRSFTNVVDQPLLAQAGDTDSANLVRVHQDGRIAVWDLMTGTQTSAAKLLGQFLALSDDGALVASSIADYIKDLPEDRYKSWPTFTDAADEFRWRAARKGDAIVVQSTSTGDVRAVLPTVESRYDDVAFSPDNQLLIAIPWQMGPPMSSLRAAWRIETRELFWVRPGSFGMREICFSPDGSLFALWSSHGEISVFDVQSGDELWSFAFENVSNSNQIDKVVFSPSSPQLLICRPYTPVEAFNLVTGQKTVLNFQSSQVVFARQGAHLAWAEGIRRWSDGQEVVKSLGAGHWRGAHGVFRGDYFYGDFWASPDDSTRVLAYRLSDGELLGGWNCGFKVREVRIVDTKRPGTPAPLVAIGDSRAAVWGASTPHDGLAIEFLPAGALRTEGANIEWTEDSAPYLRAYDGVLPISLDEFRQRTHQTSQQEG